MTNQHPDDQHFNDVWRSMIEQRQSLTVGELIAKLQQLDPGLRVFMESYATLEQCMDIHAPEDPYQLDPKQVVLLCDGRCRR